MSTNGWFSKLRADGVIASGNSGIWITPLSGEPFRVSEVGTSPVWCGQQLVFNRNDGTTQYAASVVPRAYNEYVGSDAGQWAGFDASGAGRVDLYHGKTGTKGAEAVLVEPIPSAFAPRFYGASFGYLAPYQTGADYLRALVIDGVSRQTAVIIGWVADRAGGFYVYTVGVGTYGKRLFDNDGHNVTIRAQEDETPLIAFTGIDGLPWMLSNVPSAGTFVRMIYSAWGYLITGDLYYPDARIIGDRLRVVGSDAAGQPRNLWVDFDPAKRVDLRTV